MRVKNPSAAEKRPQSRVENQQFDGPRNMSSTATDANLNCSSKDLNSTAKLIRIFPFFHRPVHLAHGDSGINSVQTEYQIQEHTSPDTLVNVLFTATHNISLP